MKNEFYATRQLLREYTNHTEPLAFSEWSVLPEEDKAAVLYLQFFDQITLAWEKTKSVYSAEEDGVSTVLQYLQKNVSKIEAEPKRFTPAYIYKVAYNCLYCVCRDPNRFKREYENECSNIYSTGEDEVDLFDLYAPTSAIESDIETKLQDECRSEIWDIIGSLDADTKLAIAKLLDDSTCIDVDYSRVDTKESYQKIVRDAWIAVEDESSHKDKATKIKSYVKANQKKGLRTYTAKQLESVTDSKMEETIEMLKQVLAPYREAFGV